MYYICKINLLYKVVMYKVINRDFIGSDAEMIENAHVTYKLFTADLAAFTTFDAALNSNFAALYGDLVETAATLVRDSVVVNQLAILTENVALAMENARGKYIEIKYFVQKTFPTSLATQQEFGFNDYLKVRRNQVLMSQFLLELDEVCQKYKNELMAKGFTQVAINEILVLRDELNTATKKQKVFQKQRPKRTEDRIMVLNSCYNYMAQVIKAAQIVYRKDYAKQQQYEYLPLARKKMLEEKEHSSTPAADGFLS
jgi:hypothetical protein